MSSTHTAQLLYRCTMYVFVFGVQQPSRQHLPVSVGGEPLAANATI